jgi:hypothetical protein
LPDFSWYNISKQAKIYQIATKYVYQKAMYQMVVKYSKWPQNIQTLFIPRPSKIYPMGIFGFENKPFGNRS